MTATVVDLGQGVTLTWTAWGDHEAAGYQLEHTNPTTGHPCLATGLLDVPGVDAAFPNRFRWTVQGWHPLTLHPALCCPTCGAQGWVWGGQWVPL